MVYEGKLKGTYVDLISATVDDAEFTLAIRQDPEFTKYLPRINNTMKEQREWLKSQRNKSGDYFFVVWDKEKNRIGTIGIFDLDEEPGKAGRLALRGNALQNIEAQYLIFKFAFIEMGVERLWGVIYADNRRAIRFAQQFGVIVEEPSINGMGKEVREVMFTKPRFLEKQPQIEKMIYRKKSKEV